jgi:hypothetical protein
MLSIDSLFLVLLVEIMKDARSRAGRGTPSYFFRTEINISSFGIRYFKRQERTR